MEEKDYIGNAIIKESEGYVLHACIIRKQSFGTSLLSKCTVHIIDIDDPIAEFRVYNQDAKIYKSCYDKVCPLCYLDGLENQ